jgi:hypothetical protein
MSATPTLLNETGQFFLDNLHSSYVTFGYSGDSDFLNRMENFFFNYGVLTKGEPHKIKECFYYVLTPYDRLEKALTECFKGEILKEKKEQIDYTVRAIKDEIGDEIDFEITWDEQKLTELANERANLFFEKVQQVSLDIYSSEAGLNEEYRLGNV